MKKIAVIGLCGMSVFLQVGHFPLPGETIAADTMENEIGGKGINQAIAARRCGAEVSYLGAIGEDAEGEFCRQAAVNEGIHTYMPVKSGKRTAYAAILVTPSGENQVIEHLGAELTPADVDAFEQEIKDCNILLLQHEIPPEVNDRAIRLAHQYGKTVILNPAPARPLAEELKPMIFAVTPNETEAAAIGAGEFANCIKTLGSKGCLINDVTLIPAIPVKAVDTVGAGDTFNGYFAAKFAETGDMELSAKWAVAASGISVTRRHVLAAIPYREEVERVLKGDAKC